MKYDVLCGEKVVKILSPLEKEHFVINPLSEARGGYTKSIQVLVLHFWTQNDHNNHLAIMKLIHFPDAPNHKLGVQNDRLDKVFKTKPDK